MNRHGESVRTATFLAAALILPIVGIYVLSGAIGASDGSYWLRIAWLAGFGLLALNNSHMLLCAVVALWPYRTHLPEGDVSDDRVDLLYVVRNEKAAILFAAMSTSLAGALGANAHLWLLSNSDKRAQASEKRLIERLQERFGAERVSLFQARRNPLRRKHVCIHEWLEAHPDSCYVVICDADTVMPAGTVGKLLRKAEHPDNRDVALFQAHIRIAHDETRFARMLSFGQEIAQRLHAGTYQRVFGRSVYYGSGCLIRSDVYRQAKAPDWVLSHDIWETVALEQHAGRIVYCGDVVTFGWFPHNMLEFIRRSRRWVAGTMEAIPLLVAPRISLATRFVVLLPIYFYLSQVLLLAWIAIGLALRSSTGPLLVSQTFLSVGAGFVHLEMSAPLALTMAIVFGHRFTQCRTPGEIARMGLECVASSLLCLNCVLFDSVAVVRSVVRRGHSKEWVPTEKQRKSLAIKDVVRELWPSTVFGLAITVLGLIYAPQWPRWTPKSGHRSTPENRPPRIAAETLTAAGDFWSLSCHEQRLGHRETASDSGARRPRTVAPRH
jgi:membrane glycosyltransferase